MPDKIKDAYSAVKSTGLFIDEADFRAQIAKDKKAVFELFNSEKSTKGLFIDEADFDAQLGLGKQPASPSGNGGASSSAQSTPPVTPSTPSGGAFKLWTPTTGYKNEDAEALRAAKAGTSGTRLPEREYTEEERFAGAEKVKANANAESQKRKEIDAERTFKTPITQPIATSRQEAESQEFKDRQAAYQEAFGTEIKRWGEVMQNKAADEFAAISQTPMTEISAAYNNATKFNDESAKQYLKGLKGNLVNDYLTYLDQANPDKANATRERIKEIENKTRGDKNIDEQEFFFKLEKDALELKAFVANREAKNVIQSMDYDAYNVDATMLDEKIKSLVAERSKYVDANGTPKNSLGGKYQEYSSKIEGINKEMEAIGAEFSNYVGEDGVLKDESKRSYVEGLQKRANALEAQSNDLQKNYSYLFENGKLKQTEEEKKAAFITEQINKVAEQHGALAEKYGVSQEKLELINQAATFGNQVRGILSDGLGSDYPELKKEIDKAEAQRAKSLEFTQKSNEAEEVAVGFGLGVWNAVQSSAYSAMQFPKIALDAINKDLLGNEKAGGMTIVSDLMATDLYDMATKGQYRLESQVLNYGKGNETPYLVEKAELFGAGVGSVLTFVAGGQALSAVQVPKMMALWGTAYVTQEGSNYREALQNGLSPSDARIYSNLISGASATVELAIPDFKYVEEVVRPSVLAAYRAGTSVEMAFKNAMKELPNSLANYLKVSGKEGAEEGIENIVTDAVKNAVNSIEGVEAYKDLFDPNKILESITAGVMVGGAMTALNRPDPKSPTQQSLIGAIAETTEEDVLKVATIAPENVAVITEIQGIGAGMRQLPSFTALSQTEKNFVISESFRKKQLQRAQKEAGVKDPNIQAEIDKIDSDVEAVFSGKKVGEEYETEAGADEKVTNVVGNEKIEETSTEGQPVSSDLQQGNEGKADTPTKENVTERTSINSPFYKKVEDALVKLGLIEKYNAKTGTGDVVGGYVQQTTNGGFSVGKLLFNQDGSISYFDGDVKVSFDKNGNVISENTKEAKQKAANSEIEGKKLAISNFEKRRDSEDFKYKEVVETDVLGNKKKVKRLKTPQELKESTDKINAAIDKSKAELSALESTQETPTAESKIAATPALVSDKKADIEKELFSETDSKGRTFTVFSTTKEKDGLIKTTFTFNRSDKNPSQRNNMITGIPVEKALGDKYTIDEDYIPEGAKVVGVSEIRIGEKGAGATVTFELDGEKFQGEVKLNSNTTYNAELVDKYRKQEQDELAKAIPNIADFDTYGEKQGNMPNDLYAIYKPIYDKYNKLITNVGKPSTTTQEGVKEGAVEEIVPDKVQEGAAKVENVKDTFENREAIEDNLKDLGDNVYYHGSDDISYMNSKEDVNTAANTKNAESKYLNLSPKASVAISYSIRQQKIGDKSGVAAFKLTGNGYVMKNADIKMLKSNEDYEAFYDKKKLEGYDYIKVPQDANDIVVLNNNAIEYVGKKLNKEALEPLSEITQGVEQMGGVQETPVVIKENRKKINQDLIDIVWKRLAKNGIDNADNLIGTRESIEEKDFDKFWSNVTKEDLQELKSLYESKKQEQLELFDKFNGEFDPSTGTITSNDTTFFDDKIQAVESLLGQPQEDVGEGVGINNLKVIDGYIFELDKDNSIGNEKVFKINDGNGNNLGKIYIVDKSGAYYIENVKLNKERTGVGYDVYKKLIATLDKPIRSGEVQNEKAKGLWDKLVKEGLAKKEGDGYVSLKPKAVEQSLQASVGEDATKQQIENFGVNKADVEPVHSVISQVFDGLKKAGLTAAKTVGDWVGIGKGSEKPYSLKINGKDVQVKNTSPDVVNGFYSPLEAIINSVKQDKMPAKQWAEKFAKGEEAKWTGLTDWLAQQEGSVSKADIQQFLKDNRIEIVEVVRGMDDNQQIKRGEEIKQAFIDEGYEIATGMDGEIEVTKDGEYVEDIESDLPKNLYNLAQEYYDLKSSDGRLPTNATKFSQYQLEGEKENYKEVLVTLPSNRLPKGYKIVSKSEYPKATESSSNFLVIDSEGYSLMGGDTKETLLKDFLRLRREGVSFKSTHFDEPNILVHLRMNTRTDAQGKKVLFLEEVQSDWGQEGKKEGFETKLSEKQKKINEWFKTGAVDGVIVESIFKAANLIGASQSEMRESSKTKLTPTAPFVMDTNAWTKLGLKVALKEAVAQGVDKIAWTTGEQQNERYDLSKQVNKIDIEAVEDEDNLFLVDISLANGAIENLEVENGIIREGNYGGQRLDNVVGKDYADKIMSTPKGESKTLEGADLKVGGKGMKGFYGSPTEGSLGIVGNVAKSLTKQEPKTTSIKTGNVDTSKRKYGFAFQDGKFVAIDNNGDVVFSSDDRKAVLDFVKLGDFTTQHSIDITPELKASVEGGQPLFKDAEAQYRIESGKNIVEAIKDFNGSPRATIALTHEIMHPTVVAIIDGAKEGNEVGLKHTQTIVDEFNKANPKNQVTVEQLIEGNDAFKDGTTSKQYRAVQEFIAKSWEKYHLEGKQGFSKAFQDVLDQITKAFQSVYKSLSGKQLTPELRKMFDEILGEEVVEQSLKETPQAQETETKIESIVSEALSELNIVKEQTPAKKQKKESKTAARKRFRENTLGFEPSDANKAVETFVRQYFAAGSKVSTESLIRELGLRGRNKELRGKAFLHKKGAPSIERLSEIIHSRLTEEQQEMIWQPDIRGVIIDILHSESRRDMRVNLEEDYLAETDADMMGMTPQQYQDYKRHERDAEAFYEEMQLEEAQKQEAYDELFSPEVIDALMDIDEMSIEEIEAKYGDAIDADGNIDEVKLNELISNEQGTKNQEGTKENISKEGGRENQKPATEEVAILEVFDTIENAQRTKKTVKGKKEAMEEAVKEYGEVGEKAIFVESNFKDIIESLKEVKDAKGNNILKVKC